MNFKIFRSNVAKLFLSFHIANYWFVIIVNRIFYPNEIPISDLKINVSSSQEKKAR